MSAMANSTSRGPRLLFCFVTISRTIKTRNSSAISCRASAVVSTKNCSTATKRKADRNATFSFVCFQNTRYRATGTSAKMSGYTTLKTDTMLMPHVSERIGPSNTTLSAELNQVIDKDGFQLPLATTKPAR